MKFTTTRSNGSHGKMCQNPFFCEDQLLHSQSKMKWKNMEIFKFSVIHVEEKLLVNKRKPTIGQIDELLSIFVQLSECTRIVLWNTNNK